VKNSQTMIDIESLTNPHEIVAVRGQDNNDARIIQQLLEAAPLSGEYEQVRLNRTNGPAIVFNGKVIAECEARRKTDTWTEWRLWQTQGGAYVCEIAACSDREGQIDLIRATVIPPSGEYESELAQRMAVMDAFEWSNFVRVMVRKQLGWHFDTQWIE
jgi:hypothetical protein